MTHNPSPSSFLESSFHSCQQGALGQLHCQFGTLELPSIGIRGLISVQTSITRCGRPRLYIRSIVFTPKGTWSVTVGIYWKGHNLNFKISWSRYLPKQTTFVWCEYSGLIEIRLPLHISSIWFIHHHHPWVFPYLGMTLSFDIYMVAKYEFSHRVL